MSVFDIRSISSVPVEPWLNGGGVTQTLATHGTKMSDPWRISLAQVERDGPYSRFDGITRVSFILRGNGVTLDDGVSTIQLAPFCAVEYDGGTAWNARLVGGPVTALNVMTAAGRYRTTVGPIADTSTVRPGCTAIVIALDSACSYGGQSDTIGTGIVKAGQFLTAIDVDRPLLLQSAPHASIQRNEVRPPVLVTIEPAFAGTLD